MAEPGSRPDALGAGLPLALGRRCGPESLGAVFPPRTVGFLIWRHGWLPSTCLPRSAARGRCSVEGPARLPSPRGACPSLTRSSQLPPHPAHPTRQERRAGTGGSAGRPEAAISGESVLETRRAVAKNKCSPLRALGTTGVCGGGYCPHTLAFSLLQSRHLGPGQCSVVATSACTPKGHRFDPGPVRCRREATVAAYLSQRCFSACLSLSIIGKKHPQVRIEKQ